MPNSSDDSIEYTGPEKEYTPDTGTAIKEPTTVRTSRYLGYHDIDKLRDNLKKIVTQTDNTINAANNELSNFNLNVIKDSNLDKAHAQLWPTELGDRTSYISYDQYKSLALDNHRAADFIKKSYEQAIRGPEGTDALDVKELAVLTKKEALLIQQFLDTYLGRIDDTAEFRTLELFQDWATSALTHTGRGGLNLQSSQQNELPISTAELDQVSTKEVREYQALFQVKVNAINVEITQQIDQLKKTYADMSEIYYKKFLGPSLQFRVNYGRNLESKTDQNSVLGSQVSQAINSFNINLNVALSDLLKRNQIFNDRIQAIGARIQMRSNYRAVMKQLTSKGASVESSFAQVVVAPDVQAYYENKLVSATPSVASDPFVSPHSALDGIEDPQAHPQYLNKSGDTITGTILVDDGVTIDGIDLGKHEHSGDDGSERVKGFNLEPKTLITSTVDPTEVVPKPLNLRLLETDVSTLAGGASLINIKIGWDNSAEGLLYETQVVPFVQPEIEAWYDIHTVQFIKQAARV